MNPNYYSISSKPPGKSNLLTEEQIKSYRQLVTVAKTYHGYSVHGYSVVFNNESNIPIKEDELVELLTWLTDGSLCSNFGGLIEKIDPTTFYVSIYID